MGPTHVENVTDLACRTALACRGPAHITVPVDFQEAPCDRDRSRRNIPGHTSHVFDQSVARPPEEQLRQAADILNVGSKVAILAGRGALGATVELEQTTEVLRAPIIKPLLGKAAVPDDSPYTTGPIGPLGTRPSQEALEECDTLLLVGTSLPYLEFLPRPGQAHGVQIDLDPNRIGLRYSVEVGLVGDAQRTLQALVPLLRRTTDRRFLERAQTGMRRWQLLMEEQGTRPDVPMKPQVVAWELGKRLAGMRS
jgi:pyruvate dehydrogenase (quinone)/pyruvate oxidase